MTLKPVAKLPSDLLEAIGRDLGLPLEKMTVSFSSTTISRSRTCKDYYVFINGSVLHYSLDVHSRKVFSLDDYDEVFKFRIEEVQ